MTKIDFSNAHYPDGNHGEPRQYSNREIADVLASCHRIEKIESDDALRTRLVVELRQFMNETMNRLGYPGPGLDDPFEAYDFIKAQEDVAGNVFVKGDGHAQLETLKAWAVMLNEIGVTDIPEQYQHDEYY